MSYVDILTVLGLFALALFLFVAKDAYTQWRTERRIQAAMAAEDDEEPTRRITLIQAAPPNSEGASRRPWFGKSPQLLDGGEILVAESNRRPN